MAAVINYGERVGKIYALLQRFLAALSILSTRFTLSRFTD
jgi:hypothetical protein